MKPSRLADALRTYAPAAWVEYTRWREEQGRSHPDVGCGSALPSETSPEFGGSESVCGCDVFELYGRCGHVRAHEVADAGGAR